MRKDTKNTFGILGFFVLVMAMLALPILAGCGGGGTTALAAESSIKTVEKSYTLSQGNGLRLIANEVLGDIHNTEELQYTSWRLYIKDLQSPLMTAAASRSFNPQYFEGLDEKGLVHPEWSRTWGTFINVPVNLDAGEYSLDLFAVNNVDPTVKVKIKIKVTVAGEKQDVPFAISGQVDTDCDRDFHILSSATPSISINAVYVVTDEEIAEATADYLGDESGAGSYKVDFPQGLCSVERASLRVSYFEYHPCSNDESYTCADFKVAYYKY